MAALRSALAMLGRGSSGSTAATYMGGRGLEISQVFRHTPPPLHTAAIRNVEGCRSFSSGIREPANKTQSGMSMWCQRAKNRMQNADLEVKARAMFVYTLIVLGTPVAIIMNKAGRL